MTEDQAVFTKKARNKAAVFFTTLIATTFLFFIMLSSLFGRAGYTAESAYYVKVAISVSLGIVVAICALISNKDIKITIDRENVTYTRGKDQKIFPISSYRGTYIATFNGVEERNLRFALPNGRLQSIKLPFENAEFSDIVSAITKFGRADEDNEESKEAIRDFFEGEFTIGVPSVKLSQALSKTLKIRSITSVILAGLAVIICPVAFVLLDIYTAIAVALIFGVMGLSFAMLLFLYGRKENKAAIECTPEFVAAGPYCITFGNEKFDASRIRKVTATPPAYENVTKNFDFRSVAVTDIKGNVHKFYFGKSPKNNKNKVFNEYASVVSLIDQWCFANNIDFRMDLA
ncbi:MAG: hypothetical protein IKH20_00665 [Clostridiales bacterium]|nr:hypothetical protein [Clostridiales bacterium]